MPYSLRTRATASARVINLSLIAISSSVRVVTMGSLHASDQVAMVAIGRRAWAGTGSGVGLPGSRPGQLGIGSRVVKPPRRLAASDPAEPVENAGTSRLWGR